VRGARSSGGERRVPPGAGAGAGAGACAGACAWRLLARLVGGAISALACSVMLSTPASAATAWHTTTLSPYDRYSFYGDMVVTAAGETVVVWRETDPSSGASIKTAAGPAGGSLGAPEQLSAGGYDVVLGSDGAGGVLAVWERDVPGSGTHLMAAYRPAAGTFGSPQDIGAGSNPELAMNAAGDAAVAFRRFDYTSDTSEVWGSTRPHGGSFAAPHAVSGAIPGATFSRDQDAAVTPDGDTIFAWSETGSGGSAIKARVEPTGGIAAPAQTLTAPGAMAYRPRIGADSASEGAVVTWVEKADERDEAGALYASIRGSLGSFGLRFALGGSADRWDGGAVETVADGTALVAWGQADPIWGATQLGPARARTVDLATGSMTGAVDLSSSYVTGPVQLAVDGHGGAIVAFEDVNKLELHVARRTGGSWGPEENLFCPYPFASPLSVGLDASGNGTVLWFQQQPLRATKGLVLSTSSVADADSPGSCPRRWDALVVTPNPPVAGDPITIDASAGRDPDAVSAQYEWSLDWDWNFEVDTGNEPSVTHTFQAPGTTPVRVRLNETSADGYKMADGFQSYLDVAAGSPPGDSGTQQTTGSTDSPFVPSGEPATAPNPPPAPFAAASLRLRAPRSVSARRLFLRGLRLELLASAPATVDVALLLQRATGAGRASGRQIAQRALGLGSARWARVLLRPTRAGRRAIIRKLARGGRARLIVAVGSATVRGLTRVERRVLVLR
jgi:hypothetical protein